jgi:ribosomal protein L3
MPGRYGGERVTIQNIKVVFAEAYQLEGVDGSLLGIQGAVPGPNNGLCFLKRSVKKYPREEVSREG